MQHRNEIDPETIVAAADIEVLALDDHVACFSRDTGTTHVIDALSGEVLLHLNRQQQPQNERSIREHLANAMGMSADDLQPQLGRALRSLETEFLITLSWP